MSRRLSWTLAVIILSICGCDKKTETVADTPTKTATPVFGKLKSRTDTKLLGTVRIADQSLRIAPMVSHAPDSDLLTNCKKAYDDAKKNGDANPTLCYDKKPRSAVTTLRIEQYTEKGFPEAKAHMVEKLEGTHFFILSTESVYQVLDLAYAARRDGELRPNEIRVLSAFPDKEKLLFNELKTYLPDLKLEIHDMRSESK